MDMTKEQEAASGEEPAARSLRKELFSDELLDELMARVDWDGLALTGQGGFLPELVKAVLERGMDAELTDHLGYERGDPGRAGQWELPQRHDPEDGRDRGRRHAAWTSRGTATPRSPRGWSPRAPAAWAASRT